MNHGAPSGRSPALTPVELKVFALKYAADDWRGTFVKKKVPRRQRPAA